jgi:phosphinothricin acetyltransferase
MQIRPATLDDAEALRDIYNPYVETTTVTFDLRPRSLEEQRAWLRAHLGVYPVVVADDGDAITGFASLSPWRDRPAYRTSVEDSVYVRRDRHGQGLGSQLLGEIVRLGDEHGFHNILARIVGGHEASIAIHTKHGFEVVGTEREVGRKFNRWLDVVVMQRLL